MIETVNRSSALALIALALGAYGLYTALYLFPMLIGTPAVLLIVGFTLQVVCALLGAVGVWGGQRWGAIAVILLGASIVLTQFFEIVLGIVPYLRAMAIAFLAIIGAVIIAAYVSRSALPPQRAS